MATYLQQWYNFETTFIHWLCFEERAKFCNGYLSLLYFLKQALIIGGIVILVVGIITTIAVVMSNQESKTQEEVDSTDSGPNMASTFNNNMAQIDNQSHNGKYYHSKVISFH